MLGWETHTANTVMTLGFMFETQSHISKLPLELDFIAYYQFLRFLYQVADCTYEEYLN